jgi:hypothetical protein
MKFDIKSSDFKFYFWINFYFSCVDNIFLFIIENIINKKVSRLLSKKENVNKIK